MSKKMKNESHVEGYVYEHKLEMKESGPNSKNPGTEFISGTLAWQLMTRCSMLCRCISLM